MSPYLVDDDVPPALAGGTQHLLQTPGGLLHHLLPLALVMILPRLTVDLHNTQCKFNKVMITETHSTTPLTVILLIMVLVLITLYCLSAFSATCLVTLN